MDASALVGSILAGRYRVERVVGEGGMGVVLAARHVEMEEDVAIKLLREDGARDGESVARFLREAKASARIRSDHVVRVRDVARLPDGRPYMVMELLDGLDLGEILARDGPMSLGVAVDHVLQASEAIGEAHSMGIVHRDLKPSNLFLTRRRNGKACVKVLDFGISKLLDAGDAKKTSTKDVFGSPMYMSPEQLVSTTDVDERADVWSMGVVLYELLVGQTPFHAGSLAELHVAILQQPAPDVRGQRPDVPAPVAEAISAALAKRREERVGSIVELATALAPFGSPVGREAFDALVATAARRNTPAVRPPSTSAPAATPTATAPLSAPDPFAGGVATQKNFTAGPRPQAKGGMSLAMVVTIAVFGLLAFVGASAIVSSLILRQMAPAEPAPSEPVASATSGAPTTGVQAATPPATATPPEEPPATATPPEEPPAASASTTTADEAPAVSAATTASAPRPTPSGPRPSVSSKGRTRLPDDRR